MEKLRARDIAVPRECMQRIVDSLRSVAPVQRVYVFGSNARGEQTPESDIDLFAIVDEGEPSTWEWGVDMRMALRWLTAFSEDGLPKGKDVLYCTQREFEQRKEVPWRIERDVDEEGVLVYVRER